VEILLSEHPDEVAAVILEPVAMNIGLVPADKEFMWGLRRLCDEYGVVLIFDEVKTSGKLYGGAEEYYGVRPDMKTMAKAVAGGYPLSIIGGRREIMEEVGPGKIPHAGTFNSNPLAVDAAIATLTEALTRDAMDRTIRLNEELARAYSDILGDAGVPHNIKVFGNSATVFFTENEIKNWHDFLRFNHVGMWWAYFIAMMNRGVVPTAPGYDEQWTISVQHTEEDIEKTIEALTGRHSQSRPYLRESNVETRYIRAPAVNNTDEVFTRSRLNPCIRTVRAAFSSLSRTISIERYMGLSGRMVYLANSSRSSSIITSPVSASDTLSSTLPSGITSINRSLAGTSRTTT